MQYDQYGRPMHGSFHAPDNTQAKIHMPNVGDLGGKGEVPFVRFPYYPTSPFYSTNPNVGTQTRFYGATLLNSDPDYNAGTESIRIIQFDIPVRLIAINAAATDPTTVVTAAAPAQNMLNSFLFRVEYTTGDRLMTAARLASTVVGTQENPGEIGGTGYTIDQGASLVLGITPLANAPTNFRIDISLVCLEVRGQTNFTR
jgi:hypothetical protein